MIRLQRSLIEGLKGPSPDPQSVRDSLQSAIELEHATIPIYLYALYSLMPSKNGEIIDIIQSVVIEEMLHMTLASNVLNAIGGSPQIDHPGFIPTYPGPLPGGVQSDLQVNLAPFSMAQLDTFLKIESPEFPIPFKASLVADETITIGEFYTAISESIAALGDGVFVDAPRNQVGPDLFSESIVVTDAATAQQAIQLIIDQGEGTSTSPGEGVGGGYAHYYRFMQIKKGHLLVRVQGGGPDPADQYAYTGDPVTFDPTGVYAVATNPAANGGYPAGSPQAFLNDNFNYSYTNLLGVLHGLFNGEATVDQFHRAVSLMMSLKGQAKGMMSAIINPPTQTGPSFEYQPVNPSIP